jgi:hypothetical protein
MPISIVLGCMASAPEIICGIVQRKSSQGQGNTASTAEKTPNLQQATATCADAGQDGCRSNSAHPPSGHQENKFTAVLSSAGHKCAAAQHPDLPTCTI